MFQVCKTFSFDAAHILLGYNGKCANLHGHHWEAAVCIEGNTLDPVGMLIDFGDVKRYLQQTAGSYDHAMLNDIPPYTDINPTSENVAKAIFHSLQSKLAESDPHLRVAYVQVWETPTSWAKYWE